MLLQVLLQALLQVESPITTVSLLITAITALATVVVFLFMYNKALNKEIRTMGDLFAKQLQEKSESFAVKLQEVYRDQLKDNKEIIEKNTRAFVEHSAAIQ